MPATSGSRGRSPHQLVFIRVHPWFLKFNCGVWVEAFYQTLQTDQRLRIVTAQPSQWERGLALYFQRPDKNWSLTDCISFAVMNDEGLTDALTGDRHFKQAGFTVLLSEK